MGYMGNTNSRPPGGSTDFEARTRIKELERRLNRIELEHRALWEILRDAAKMTNDDLDRRVKEIDLRDGVEDQRVTAVPLRCPVCKRVASSRHWRCLYCGQEFEKYTY